MKFWCGSEVPFILKILIIFVVFGENCRPPIFSADSSNRTVRDNTAAGPPEISVPRFFAGHISCGAGPDCHRSGQSPVPVSPPLLLGRG